MSIARALVSLGADPANADERRRYLELIAPGEEASAQDELAATSSPALLVAGVLRLAGVSNRALDPPYALGAAFRRLVQVAEDAGAWVPFAEDAAPSRGDVVFATGEGGVRHVYIVTSVSRAGFVELETVEGGHRDSSGYATIVARKRSWQRDRDSVVRPAPRPERPPRSVDGWVDVSRLPRVSDTSSPGPVNLSSGDVKRLSPDVTRVTADEMHDALATAWRDLFSADPRPESIHVLVAQWALETGWGKAMHAYNVGNIKSIDGDEHDFTYFACDEIIGGKVVWFYPDARGCRFRAYESLELGAADYLATIHKRFNAAWGAVLDGDPAAYSHILKTQKYYTASEAQYTKTIVSVFNDLVRTAARSRAASPSSAGPSLYTTLGLQQALRDCGYDPGTIDGKDGPHTRAAVEAFQRDAGLVADGIVGSATRAALADARIAHERAPAS